MAGSRMHMGGHTGRVLADGLTFLALLLFAAVAPLLPNSNLKVDATVLATLLLAVAVYIRIRAQVPLGRSSLDMPAAAFLLVAVLATVLSISPFTSFFPSTLRGDGLLVYVGYVGMALAMARLRSKTRDAVLTAILLSGSVIGMIAVTQYYGVDVMGLAGLKTYMPAEYYALDPRPPSGIGLPFGARSYGTLGNPIFLGGYASLLLPLAVVRAIHTKEKAWWGYCASALLYGALIGSQSRAAWIASAGAAGILWGLLPKSRQVYRRLAALVVIFASVTITIVLTQPQVDLSQRAASAFDPKDESLQGRLYIWRHTVPLIAERPVFGWGFSTLLGRFPQTGVREFVRRFGYYIRGIDTPHNELLHIAYSTGLLGLAAYLWVWVAVGLSLRATLRRPPTAPSLNAALLASLLAYFVWLQSAWTLIGPANIFWTFAGLAVALRRDGGGQ